MRDSITKNSARFQLRSRLLNNKLLRNVYQRRFGTFLLQNNAAFQLRFDHYNFPKIIYYKEIE